MKYVVLIGDGMADDPQEQYGGKTPLEAARTPNLDRLSRGAVLGLVRTVPAGMNAGSDVANMAILGYDPSAHYTGRAPIEAAAACRSQVVYQGGPDRPRRPRRMPAKVLTSRVRIASPLRTTPSLGRT